ncbi:AraC family transcriptional regulator [Methylobacterium sp. XJLW]|uniref:Transcriptional regulator GlxA family with amidase domain n=1 Tax=Methylobacterium fujisawaense TaxID=107400 RepID=A0ABR6DB16_9HYPH|nr:MULTISPECIES: helix-turn-helix domain-containing protein [Methylobacterium]AWV17959.1 AraC family transcriptional regulator [Methylobacterium sp. XJLW]MBA9063285.1 transcriptional regulator GlxA family with amidase domain [Methylobacterium fujisawaense]RUP14489.1 MAG: helix-turn-helix domain-containing protein [Methylobacterium sp.]
MPKSPRFSPDPPRPVEVLAFPSVQLLDVAGPLQVFATANEHGGAGTPYAPRVIAAGDPGLTASAGLRLVADPLPDLAAPVDTLVIAGGPGVVAACDDAALVAWVRARAGRARRVASVCTGAFLLGAAGLLDGRRAVTHWKHCGALAARYRRARIEPDPIFVRDGPVWSSAGVTAGIDLTLALVEEDLGRATALAVARHLVMFLKRPGGQAQFSAALALQAGEERFGRLHAFMADNLSGDLSLPALAAAAGMSARSLSRHYLEATGLTPAKAVERLRVEAARRALAETAQPVKRIARTCGFGSEETLRRSFLRHVAATPQAYRARFGG